MPYRLGHLADDFGLAEPHSVPDGMVPHRAGYDALMCARTFTVLAGSAANPTLAELLVNRQPIRPPLMPRSSSDHHRGLGTVDGPTRAGKSTIVAHSAQLLDQVHRTARPSTSAIGALARDLIDTVTGPALACLYASHRYHHLDAGEIDIGDRHVPSSLVMQRFDGVGPEFLWALNSAGDRTDVALAFDADPAIIITRVAHRGSRNRFHRAPGSSQVEAHFDRASPRTPAPRRLPRTTA